MGVDITTQKGKIWGLSGREKAFRVSAAVYHSVLNNGMTT